VVATAKLSFGLDVDDGTSSYASGPDTLRLNSLDDRVEDKSDTANPTQNRYATRRLGPNASVACAPKVMTKLALVREAQTREQLRSEFLVLQERVKETEILIPFTFYDGGSLPGGVCRVKKGDHIWLFLDKARKVGAELGVGGVDKSRREWARISVEDLMLVKGEIIIPHVSRCLGSSPAYKLTLVKHYDFYHFIMNKVKGIAGPLFAHSAQLIASTPTVASNRSPYLKNSVSLSNRGPTTENIAFVQDCALEGADHDPNLTRVVDRRWYERNKHIFPASVWEEYDPTRDYSQGIRKDSEGNTFFFA